MKKLIILSGIPGCGKSTFARNNFHNATIISRDQIRFSMMGENYFQNEKLVFKEFIRQINESLITNEITVVDGTHINNVSRKKLLSNLTIPEDCEIDCYCFKISASVCKERNANRNGLERVPDEVITDFALRFTVPRYDGEFKFHKIYLINESGDVSEL